MKKTRTFRLLGIVSVVLAATAAPSLATPLRIPLTTQTCKISNATPLAFNTVVDANVPRDGRASFVVTCPRTQTATIALLYSHRMKGGTRDGDLLYDLYATPNHSAIWGSGGDGSSISQTFSAGSPTTLFIYARIPAHQQPMSGQFRDSVDIVAMP